LDALGSVLHSGLVKGVEFDGSDSRKVSVHWDKVVRESKTTSTLQVMVNPPLRRGSTIHDPVFRALRDLGCDYVRYVSWLSYPKLGVAELEPPKDGKASRDFSLIDPSTTDLSTPPRA